MNEHIQSPTEVIATLEKRLAAMEAEKVNLVAENVSLRQLYERAPLSYQSLDEKGCFLAVNQAWLDSLGYAKEEVIGQNFSEFLHPNWKNHFKDDYLPPISPVLHFHTQCTNQAIGQFDQVLDFEERQLEVDWIGWRATGIAGTSAPLLCAQSCDTIYTCFGRMFGWIKAEATLATSEQ